MKILIGILAILMIAGVCQAVEPKVSYFYEVGDSEFMTLIGTSVKEDVNGIKGLDIDVWYKFSKPGTEISLDENEFNNLIMPGVSYAIDYKGFDVGVNAGAGLERIEALTSSDRLGEFKYGIGLIVGKKF